MKLPLSFVALASALLALPLSVAAQPARPFVRGDLDGDGFADLVHPFEGGVAIFHGGAHGPAPRPELLPIYPVLNVRRSPMIVAADALEDLDGDGRAELVTVAQDYQVGDREVTVRVAVRSGASLTRVLWEGTDVVPAADLLPARFAVRAAGDLDRNGHPDLVAGGMVIFAQPVSGVRVASLVAGLANITVFPLGDLDGNGGDDLWVAPLRHDSPPPFYGAVGVRGGDGSVLSRAADGRWRARPFPLFASVLGGAHLVDVRAADVTGDLVAVSAVPPMAIDAVTLGTTSTLVARRLAPGRYDEPRDLPSPSGGGRPTDRREALAW